MRCEDCVYSGRCHKQDEDFYIIGCGNGNPNGMKTNADMIRGMRNDELEELINKIKECGGHIARETSSEACVGCNRGICGNVREWLESEVSE